VTDDGDRLIFEELIEKDSTQYSGADKNVTGFEESAKEVGSFSGVAKNVTDFDSSEKDETIYSAPATDSETDYSAAEKETTAYGEFTGDIYNTANEYNSDQYYNGKEIVVIGTIFSGNAKERTEWS
jgi:hypothetical protein